MARKTTKDGKRIIADNRKARYNYDIQDTLEAGIVLTGTEVKALRAREANIAESYASDEDGGIWLINAYVPEYEQGNRNNHEPRRRRKLLLHAREIDRWTQAVAREGMTMVPLRLYFDPRGRAKLELALGKGKKTYDKRETEKKRDWQRDKARLMRERGVMRWWTRTRPTRPRRKTTVPPITSSASACRTWCCRARTARSIWARCPARPSSTATR